MTLWAQFNPHRRLADVMAHATGLACAPADDTYLYKALKRHLTRRELRAFAMHHGEEGVASIAENTGLKIDDVMPAIEKVHRKLRQKKCMDDFQKICLGNKTEKEN